MPLVLTTRSDTPTLVTVQEGRAALFQNKPAAYNTTTAIVPTDPEIAAAILDAEESLGAYTQRAVTPTRFLWTFTRTPIRDQPLPLPRPPITTVHRLRWRFGVQDWTEFYEMGATNYVDAQGNSTPIPSDARRFELLGDQLYLDTAWPRVIRESLILEADYEAGYSDASRPNSFRNAVFSLLLSRSVPEGATAASLTVTRNAGLAGVEEYRLSSSGHPALNAEARFGG